jgi:hypothetical protein
MGKYYLGRKVVDSYGRTLGKVVGYYMKAKNSLPIVGLELTSGIFKAVPSSKLIDEANILVLDADWKKRAEDLTQNLTLNIRKTSALNRLYKSGEISSDAYESLTKDFDVEIQDLKTQHKGLLDKLGERSTILNAKLKEVENYFVNIKVAHELGEMDDEAYRISRDALHDLINRLQAEHKDIAVAQESLEQAPTSVDIAENVEKPSEIETRDIPAETPLILRIEEAEK